MFRLAPPAELRVSASRDVAASAGHNYGRKARLIIHPHCCPECYGEFAPPVASTIIGSRKGTDCIADAGEAHAPPFIWLSRLHMGCRFLHSKWRIRSPTVRPA